MQSSRESFFSKDNVISIWHAYSSDLIMTISFHFRRKKKRNEENYHISWSSFLFARLFFANLSQTKDLLFFPDFFFFQPRQIQYYCYMHTQHESNQHLKSGIAEEESFFFFCFFAFQQFDFERNEHRKRKKQEKSRFVQFPLRDAAACTTQAPSSSATSQLGALHRFRLFIFLSTIYSTIFLQTK